MNKKRETDKRILDFENTYASLGVSKNKPDFLFHYTSLAGLEAILSEKRLRSSHILDMRNDVEEFKHGMELFSSEVKKFVDKGFHTEVGKNLQEFFLSEAKNPKGAPCILCTTPVPNKEYHWREYGGNGTGYCLKLGSALEHANDVVYDEKVQMDLVKKIGEEFLKLLDVLDLDDRQNNTDALNAYFFVSFIQSLRFKKAKWADEAEWRAWLFLDRDKLQVVKRADNTEMRCEYVSIDPIENWVSEIIIGPKLDFEAERKRLSGKFPGFKFVKAE